MQDLTPRRHSAFTLMEVMVAVTIFLIAAGALFITFRTGIRAYQVGHSGAEIYQTARIAQDMVTRDMTNVFYRSESDYNRTFRAQVIQIAQYNQGMGSVESMPPDQQAAYIQSLGVPPVAPEDITLPIDLSFHGKDDGELDTLSFAVRQVPRPGVTAQSLGMIRVKYYVRDAILYREEANIYGLRPGDELVAYLEGSPELGAIAQDFVRQDEDNPLEFVEKEEGTGLNPEDDPENPLYIPPVAEPLCEGVELFNITYGYYYQEEWTEVEEWDSSAWKYRFPFDQEKALSLMGNMAGEIAEPGLSTGPQVLESGFSAGGLQRRGGRTAFVRGQQFSYVTRPDDLPGFVAIQLGIRDPQMKGRLHSFTFYVSPPTALEDFDATMIDEDQGGPNSRRQGGTGLSGGGVLGRGVPGFKQ